MLFLSSSGGREGVEAPALQAQRGCENHILPPFSLRKHLLVRTGGVGERLRRHCILQWFFSSKERSSEPSPWVKQTNK